MILFIGVLTPLYIFGSLAEDVAEREAFWFDRPVLLFLHAQATSQLDALMLFVTALGSVCGMVVFDLLVLVCLLRWRGRDAAAFWVLAVVGAEGMDFIAKHVFLRIRPSLWTSIAPKTTYSFPSAHAMNSMAAVSALILLCWGTKWRHAVIVAGTCFIVLVGLSRMYLGVHYPSDILGGWTASLAWVVGLSLLFRRHRPMGTSAFEAAGKSRKH